VRRFGAALAPLTRGRAVFSETEGREIVRLESFEASVSFAARQAELSWFYLFAYLAEVADTFARDRESDPKFYRLLCAATDASEAGVGPGTVRRWFEAWTLRLQGLLPDFSVCPGCGTGLAEDAVVVAIESGEARCGRCAAEPLAGTLVRLGAAEARWVRSALTSPVTRVAEPGAVPGFDRMVQLLFVQFTGGPFRTARFLEAL
jgi:DNA repair protein RecO (recombination protein O)